MSCCVYPKVVVAAVTGAALGKDQLPTCANPLVAKRLEDSPMRSDCHNKLYFGDNLEILCEYVADESVDLTYLEPPFNSKATADRQAPMAVAPLLLVSQRFLLPFVYLPCFAPHVTFSLLGL